jgi:predicted ATPase
MKLLRLELTNFLSYRDATLELGDFVALVGPNASGKSNAVAAIKLLRDIPQYGLPIAIARRGGFDQLRHRSEGRPYDPGLAIDFTLRDDLPPSRYELRLGALSGKRYEVKHEFANIHSPTGHFTFTHARGKLEAQDDVRGEGLRPIELPEGYRIPPGQSAAPTGPSLGGFLLFDVLSTLQTVEINPARVAELQDPASTREYAPDGSNTASFFELLSPNQRQQLVDELSAVVPGIIRIEPRRFADKLTLVFYQETAGRAREFLAKQMSDGTLRAFSILLAMLQPRRPSLLVIEEPEIAIHLGALRTLVDILRQYSEQSQIVVTTHSADIVDSLDVDSLRVVWSDNGASRIARVASHTLEPVRRGLITPGELLRSDSLDPAVA